MFVSENHTIKDWMKIYTDGSCNPQTVPYAWASVVDEKGTCLIDINHKSNSTFPLKIEPKTMFGKKSKETRNIILTKFDDVQHQQNNGAELVAFIIGLEICVKNYDEKKELKYNTVCCDSDLIVKWWSVKGPSSNNTNISKEKRDLIDYCMKLRKQFEEKGGLVEKIKGDDNLADMGKHVQSKKRKRKDEKEEDKKEKEKEKEKEREMDQIKLF